MISIFPESKALLTASADFSSSFAGPMAEAIARLPADSLPSLGLRRYAVAERMRVLAFYVRQFVAAWRRRREALQTLRALGDMNDHQLQDLGLHRSELMSVAYNPGDETRARSKHVL
jgi:uncharacterized protein YjiS (DUF1127 family)